MGSGKIIVERGSLEWLRSVRTAKDFIMSYDHQTQAPSSGLSSLATFMANMASGQGHHSKSSGQSYELWLDFTGDLEAMQEPRRVVLQLFWQVRNIVDKLGLSLFKEGRVDGVVVDMEVGASFVKQWDYTWLPLVLVDEAGTLHTAQTKTPQGWLRKMADGKVLTSSGSHMAFGHMDFYFASVWGWHGDGLT